jgi:hypothetical protein
MKSLDTQGATYWDRAPPLMATRLDRVHRLEVPDSPPPEVRPDEVVADSYLVKDDSEVMDLVESRLSSANEVLLKGLPTNQYPNEAYSLKNLAPKHSTKRDENLFLQTVMTRLRRSSRSANVTDFNSSLAAGQLLFRNLSVAMSWNQSQVPLDEEAFLDCILEAQEARVSSKPLPALLRSDSRSDPNWLRNYFQAFVKSQQKVSKTAPYAGQVLAEMSDESMFLYNPMARYILRMILKDKPTTMFLAAKSTTRDMDNFCKDNWADQYSHESDAKAFDQSQRGEALQLEQLVMWHYSMPPYLIDMYLEDKVSYRCQLYTIATQRLTGEAFTWLFNTLFNIAYTYTRYDVRPDDPQAYGGDDQVVNRLIDEKPTWAKHKRMFCIEVKTVQTERPSFCSYRFTANGAFKLPENVLLKALILSEEHKTTSRQANAVGLLQEILPTYFAGDVAYAYMTAAEQAQLRQAALTTKQIVGRYWWYRSVAKLKTSGTESFREYIQGLPPTKAGRAAARAATQLYGHDDPKTLYRILRALRPDLGV